MCQSEINQETTTHLPCGFYQLSIDELKIVEENAVDNELYEIAQCCVDRIKFLQNDENKIFHAFIQPLVSCSS